MVHTIFLIFGQQGEGDVESVQTHLTDTDKGHGSSPAAFAVLPHKFTFIVCRQLSYGHTAVTVHRVSLLIVYTAATHIQPATSSTH